MAFTSAVTLKTVFGNKRVNAGTFTNTSASTGGDIDTGLRNCEGMLLQHSGAAVTADAPAVNGTLPVAGKAVTIVTTADADGYWIAIGH